MKRICVISDTHGSSSALDAVLLAAGEADGYFHLGDVAGDAKRIAEKTGKPVYAVLGNCDWGFSRETEECVFPAPQKRVTTELVVRVEDARIFLTHGHLYDVDMGGCTLGYRAEELNCAAALYGHTHRGELSAFGRVLKLNPGSPSRPRGGSRPSYAILEVDGGDVNAGIKILGES
ncbi:MAG: metallophosphoesterase [Clostridia bacterium]|nr:metallophosphoesterase [Clostridia bacterium]